MDYSAMLTFLTEDNIKRHFSYMRTLKLKYSILEKSLPEIKGKTPLEISRMSLKKSVKSEILPNLVSIKSHETYFRSFTANPAPCREIKKFYSSEDAFCYEAFTIAREFDYGFVYVIIDERGRLEIKHTSTLPYVHLREEPILALDLYEHAYFLDYGFSRDEYLRSAISHFNLSKLSARISSPLDRSK